MPKENLQMSWTILQQSLRNIPAVTNLKMIVCGESTYIDADNNEFLWLNTNIIHPYDFNTTKR